MSIEWFVAQRYLRSPNRPVVLRLVTVFSVLGVAAGVCTLVISLAMNTGFRETLQEHLLSVTSHVSLTRPGSSGIHDYDALAKKLATIPGIRTATPAVYRLAKIVEVCGEVFLIFALTCVGGKKPRLLARR